MYKQSKPFQLSRKENISFSNTHLVQRGLNPHAEPQEGIHASLSHPSPLQNHHREGSQGAVPAAQGQQLGSEWERQDGQQPARVSRASHK